MSPARTPTATAARLTLDEVEAALRRLDRALAAPDPAPPLAGYVPPASVSELRFAQVATAGSST